LVILEVALSLVLLVGGGLLLRSYILLSNVPLGFATDRVLAVGLSLPNSRYETPEKRLQFFQSLEQRLQSVPGIRAIGFANRIPLRGGWGGGLELDRSGSAPQPADADLQAVNPGYFPSLGISVLRGRRFEQTDRDGAPAVMVVNN